MRDDLSHNENWVFQQGKNFVWYSVQAIIVLWMGYKIFSVFNYNWLIQSNNRLLAFIMHPITYIKNNGETVLI